MTPKMLFSSIDKRVVINAAGKKAFTDVDGTFYLVGVSKEMFNINGKRTPVYCGFIAHNKINARSRKVNIQYIELEG